MLLKGKCTKIRVVLAACRPSKEFRELRAVGGVTLVKQPLVDVVPDNVEKVHHADKKHYSSISYTSRLLR